MLKAQETLGASQGPPKPQCTEQNLLTLTQTPLHQAEPAHEPPKPHCGEQNLLIAITQTSLHKQNLLMGPLNPTVMR